MQDDDGMTGRRASDATNRLIGSFFVNFSKFITHLEYGIAKSIGIDNPIRNRIVGSITGSMTAGQLREQFFAATALMRAPTPAEVPIRKALNTRAQDLIQVRNDLAHGTWYGYTVTGGEDGSQIQSFEPTLARVKATLRGPDDRNVLTSRNELRAHASEANEMANLLWDYQSGLFRHRTDMPGVTDRLGFLDGRLVRLDLTGWAPPS